MPTPLETYRAWERTGPFVHVMQIDRGDGTAANRLTLTDAPYYDKGVSGVKYHETYPAPVYAITSEIQFEEAMGGTRFSDIVLANGEGRFDSILGSPNILKRRFTILRGHPDWSLMEDEFPYRFVPIMRGQVDGVVMDRGQVTLQISPVRYALDNLIGAPDQPVAFGSCRNLPFTVVDAGLLRYRCNTAETTASATYFNVRDAGSPLTITTDYTEVLESGVFKGQIELVTAAAGQLTADQEIPGFTSGYYFSTCFYIARRLLAEYGVNDYSIESSTKDITAQTTSTCRLMFSASKMYACTTGGVIYQYTLANPISGASYDSASFNIGASLRAAWLTSDSEYVYILESGTLMSVWEMTTPGTITTMTHRADVDLSALGITDAQTLAASEDESRVIVWAGGGSTTSAPLYQVNIPTPRTFSGLTLAATNYAARFYIRHGAANPNGMHLSADGLTLTLGLSDGNVFQLLLPTANSVAEVVPAGKHYAFRYSGGGATIRGSIMYAHFDTEVYQLTLPSSGTLPDQVFGTHAATDEVYPNYIYHTGIAYQGQTECGTALADALAPIACSYCIDRLGVIRANRYIEPDYAAPVHEQTYPIYFSDFVGDRGQHIKLARTFDPAYKVTIEYDRNFTVQDPAALSGITDPDDVEYYGKPNLTFSDDTTLTDVIDPREIYQRGNFAFKDPTSYAASELALWDSARKEYDLQVVASVSPGYEDFSICSMVNVTGDWDHPDFADGDQMMVAARRVNMTRNIQTLTVFK